MFAFLKIFLDAFRHWFAREANIYAAALAYFAPFALIPLLALAVVLVGLLVGEAVFVEALMRWGSTLAPDITPMLVDAVTNFTWSEEYWGIPFLGAPIFLWVLLSTLLLLVRGMYQVWCLPQEGMWHQIELLLRSGLFFLLLTAFLMLAMALSVFTPDVFGERFFSSFLQSLVMFILIVGLFTVSFGILVREPLRFSSRLIGATTVAVLLLMLRFGLGWWLAFTPAIDLFGAAGVLLGLLILIYAMTAVIFYGAAVAYQVELRLVRGKIKDL